ncbi:MAG TPA: hypothetical protein VN929_12075 [Burkholderiales bacterium]|nr:hypothetical protein [Burkholderiales bacterium]
MRTWIALATAAAFAPLGLAQHGASSSNMALLGHSDLQGRSAYQPVIHEQNGRWIAYVGHHGGRAVNSLTGREEDNGTSVVDVTDPRRPRYLAHIPGEPGQAETGGAQMARVCSGKDLPKADKSKFYLLRTFGNLAHEVWDVTAPDRPARVVTVVDKLKGTHKSWWECDSGIAYLVSGLPDWRTRRMTQVYDLSDPARPVLIRNFGLPGQQPGASGPVPTELHGPISTGPKGNRVYFGYGTNKDGVMQVVDRAKLLSGPREPTPENLLAPQVGRFNLSSMNGAHTSLPVIGMEVPEFAKDKAAPRDFVIVVNESLANECQEPRQMLWVVDVTDEKVPVGVATFNVPEASGGFCTRGGRFGAHSSNENQPPMYAKRTLFAAWFNAGVRAIDIRDPFHPREIGYYIPATSDKTDKRCVKAPDGAERCKVAIQTNNLEVDDRGYIYTVDRANTGMHILELSH